MIQQDLPVWPDPETLHDGYTVPYETILKLGKGDAAAGRRLLRTLIDVEVTRAHVAGPSLRPPDVRVAGEADEPAILELLRRDHEENAASVAPFDEERSMSFIHLATRERVATIGLLDEPEGPVGMVYLVPEMWWFSPNWYIAERLLYVLPEYRKSKHGRTLLRFAQWFVDDMGAELGYRVFLISSVVGTQDVDRKVALFGRMMQRAGAVYVYPTP